MLASTQNHKALEAVQKNTLFSGFKLQSITSRMKFPVDLLASVDPGALELSAKDCMSKLLYRSPEIQESLRLPDSKEIAIDLCNVSFVPLYGYDTDHKILGLYSREDIHTAVGFHLLGKWWSFEDILKTADPSRAGLLEVRTPIERIVLHVLNKFIYKAKEKDSDEDPFLCHKENQIAKILWKDGEAIGFYSFIPEGTLCDSFVTQCYQLPVMDTLFVRKLHRGKGYGLQMLEDFVHTFSNKSVGLKYPLPAAMYKVCRSYLSAYPDEKQLLWEVRAVGAPYQRTLISKKLQTMELKVHHQFVRKLNFETENSGVLMDKVIHTPPQKTGVEYTVMEEEEVQLKITKEVNDTPVTTLARSGNLKRKMLGQDTEATMEKTIRVEAIEAAVQSAVHEAEAVRSGQNIKETTTTVNRSESNVVCVTCVHCGKHIEQTTESEEFVQEMSAPPRTTAELATVTSEKGMEQTVLLQMTSDVAEMQSMNSSEETQISESVEASIGAASLQALEVQQLVEEDIEKLTSEKATEKTELLQITSNVAEIQSMNSSKETQISESVEGSIGAADLQALDVQQLVEVEIGKLTSEKAIEKTDLLQMTSNIAEIQSIKSSEGTIGAADFQAYEIQPLIEVEIDKELASETEMIKERTEKAGGVKDGKDEADDKMSEKVISEVSSLEKSCQQTGLHFQPVTMGSENSSTTEMRVLRKSTAASQQKSTYLHTELQVTSESCPTKATKPVIKHKSVQRSFKAVQQEESGQILDMTANEADQQMRSEVQMVEEVVEKVKGANKILQEKDVQSQDDAAIQDENIEIYGEKMIIEVVEISKEGAEIQKEIDSEMNLQEKGEESSVVSTVSPATDVEQHDTTQELSQPDHQAIAEETEESRNENMEIDQAGVAMNESEVNVELSVMEKENTEQIPEQELTEDTRIIQKSMKCKETVKITENNEEFQSDCTISIEEEPDAPLKETQTHQEIHGHLEIDAIKDASEPSHVNVGEKSYNLTEPTEKEVLNKPGTSGKHGGSQRSDYSTPVRRSGRFKDQSVEGELTKIVLRSGTKLTTPISIQKQVQHTKIVKQQESKMTEKDLGAEDGSKKETSGDVMKITIVDTQDGDESKDKDQGRVADSADTNQGIMEVTQEEEPLKETQTLQEIQGQLTGRVLRSGTKSVTTISKQKQVQHTKTVKKSIQTEDKSQKESAEMETVDTTNVESITNLQYIVEEENKLEEEHFETESTAEKDVKEVEGGSEDKTIGDVTKIVAVDLDVSEVMNDGEIQVEGKTTLQSDVELIEEQEKEPATELAENEDSQSVVVVSSKETGEIKIAMEQTAQSQEDQDQDLAKLACTETNVEESEEDEVEKSKQTEALIELSETEQTDGKDVASTETVYTVEEHELQKDSNAEEMDVLAAESHVEPAEKEQKDGNDDISAEIMHTEEEDHLHKAVISEEIDVLAAEPLVEPEEEIQEDESHKTSAETIQPEEEDHLNKAIVAEEVDAFAEMGAKEPMVQMLEMQVEEVSEDKPPRTDSGQEESVPVGEEVKDDTVEPVTLEEESVAAKRHTSERAKNQTAVQESLTSNNEVNIQKTSPEEGTPIITSRSLRQRIVTVQGSPQRKSKRFQKSKMEIAENEHVVVVEVTDKTDESRTEETEENKSEIMETKDDTISKDQDQGGVQGSADADQDLMEVTQEEETLKQTQILQEVQGQESSHVHVGEKSAIWTEPTEEQVSDKPGTSVKHGRSRKSNYSTPVIRSGRFKDQSVKGELSKIVLRSGTKLTTAISKHTQVRHTKTVKQQEKKSVQSDDEPGADLQDSVIEHSKLGNECLELETTNDSYLKEVEIRIEDGSQDETTGDSVKITVVDVAEVGKDIEPEVEGKPQREEEEELNKTSISEKEDALTEIGVGEPITEGLIEQATEPSADRLTKDIEETIQENVPEEKTPVITSRSLRQRTVMVTSTPQRKSNKKVAEIGQNIDEEMVTEISSKSNDEDKTTEGQVEVDKAGKMSYTLQEIPEIEATKDKEDASQNETIREVVKITVVDMAEEGEGEIKEQAIELCADSDTLVIDSSEQGVSMQTKGEDNRIGDTSLNKESTAEMVIETSKVYTREDQEVLESDHGETVQESVLEEETSVIPSRSLRRRTVMVTSTPQRSKSKHLQKKEGVLVTEQIEDSIAETDQSKDEKMKAEVSSRSNNGDRAPRGQVEVVDKEEIVKVYTYQEISTTESSQADETQEELPAELVEEHHLEPVIEIALGQGEQKDTEIAEEAVEAAAPSKLQEASVVLVDFYKASSKQSAEIIETSKETDTVPHEEITQDLDEPASTSMYVEERKSEEDMLKKTDVCFVQAYEEVVVIAENKNVAMHDYVSKPSKGETSEGKVDSNNENMETEEVQGKDLESVISIVQEIQSDTQELKQFGEQEKLASQPELAEVEHSIKRDKAQSTRITEISAVGTPVRLSEPLTEQPTTSELTIRILRSATKQVQSTPNKRSTRQTKAMKLKDISQAVDMAEEEAKKSPPEVPTEIAMEDKIEAISVTTEETTVLQDIELRVADSHSGDEEMEESSIRSELFPEHEKDTEVLQESKEATREKDSEKDISTDQVIQGETQEQRQLDKEKKSDTQIELVEAEHSKKRGKAYSTRQITEQSAFVTPVRHSKQLTDQPTTSELSQRVLRSCTKEFQSSPNQRSTQQTKATVRKGKTIKAVDEAEKEEKDKPTEVPTKLANEDKIETVGITTIELSEEDSHHGDEEMEVSDIRTELFPEHNKEDEVTTEDVVLKEATEATTEDKREKISDLYDNDIEINAEGENRTPVETMAETGPEEAPVPAAENGVGEKTDSLLEPVEKSVGGNETYTETTQPPREEEDELNKASVAEKEDAFADTGVAEPIKDALLEQAIETGGDAHILIIDSGEQKQSTQTEDTDNTSGETSLYEESISVVAKETVMVYTSEIPEVLEPDHGETVQEIVPEEMTSAVTSRSLRRRTVMVTSTPQRSKSKNLQKTKVALVTEKNKGRTAETNQSKDEKMEAEFSFKSNDGDRAPEDQMEVVDEEAVVVSYTPQVIPTSESSQADESAVTETYLTEGVKDAGHTAQEELPTELIEEHHLEPVIEISPGQGGQKDIKIAEESVETAAPLKLQEASVVLVDFYKASSKQSAEISKTSKETDSLPPEEVIQGPNEPVSSSSYIEEKTSEEDMLIQTDVCVLQAENKQADEEEVGKIAENENVEIDAATNKFSKGETSAGEVDSNNEKMETEEVKGKDLESVTSMVQEIQGDIQEPRQVGEQKKLDTQTELAEVEHSNKRGKALSTRITTERSAVVTPERRSEQHTEHTTTSEMTIRVLRSSTKQVQSTPTEGSTQQSKATVRKVRSNQAVGTAEKEDKGIPTKLPTELAMGDKIEAISITTEGATVLQDIELSVEDSHSGDKIEVDIRTELFPEQDEVTEVLEEAREATIGKDSEKDISTVQEKENNDTQEPRPVCEEEKSVTQIELVDIEHSRKKGKAHSTKKATERSIVRTPVGRSEHLMDQHTTSELTERVLRSSTKLVQSTPNERSTRKTKELVRKGKSAQAVEMAEEEDKETEVPTEPSMEDTIEAVSVPIEGTAVLQDIELTEKGSSEDEEMEELSIWTELFPEQDKDTEILEEAKDATTGKDISTDQVIKGDTQEPGQVGEEEKSSSQIELVEAELSRKRGKAYSTRKTTHRSALETPVRHSEQLTDQPTTSELSQRILRRSTKQVQSTPNQRSTQETKTMMRKGKIVQAVDKAEDKDKDKSTEVSAELAEEDKIETVVITTIGHREEDFHPGDEEMEISGIRTELFLEKDKEDEVIIEDGVLIEATEPKEASVPASESISVFTVQKPTVVLVDFKKVTPKQTSGIQATQESQKEDEQEDGSGIEASTKATLELEEQYVLNKADDLEEQQKVIEIMVEKSTTETLEEPSVEEGKDTIPNNDSKQEKVMLVEEKLTETIILEEESTATEVEKMVAVCTSTTEASQKENQESLTPDHRGNVLEKSPEEETPIILSRSLRKRIVSVSSSPQRKTKCLPKHGVEANADSVELDKTVDNVNTVENSNVEVTILEKSVEKDEEVGNKASNSEEMLLEIPEAESCCRKDIEAMASETSITVEVEATTSPEEHQVSVVKITEVNDGHEYIKNKDGGLMEGSHVKDMEEEKDLDKIPSGNDTSPTNVVVETTLLTEEGIERDVEVSEMKNTECHLIKPAQEKRYEESSDEDELILTKNLRRRFITVESPKRRKGKRHNIVETRTEKAQPVPEETTILVEVSSQREPNTSAGIQITETPTNSTDGSEYQAQCIGEVMRKEVTSSEKQGSTNVTVIVVETEERQKIGSIGMVEGAPEENMEERTTEHTIFEKVEVKDLTVTNLQEKAAGATSEKKSGQQPQQEQEVLNKAEELLTEEKSEGVSRRRVVGEKKQGKQLTEKKDIGNESTAEELFYEFEEGAEDGRRLLRKRTITTTKTTKATTERKSKRMCKQSDVAHAGSALSVEEQATEQSSIVLTAEKEKEKETTGLTEQDNEKDRGEMLPEKAKDRGNPEGEGTCGETNTSISVRKETTKDISVSVEELSTKIEIKKGEKGEEKDGVTIVETVKELKELNEKNPVEYSEITLATDESFILQLEEEDENNGPKETNMVEEMEVSLMGSSNLGSPSIQTQEHMTQGTKVEKEGKEAAVKSKRVSKGRSPVTASLQQISSRQSKRFLQESELEGKSETIKEKAEKHVTEEQSQLKRKAIADTPRRSKRLATPKSV
uniref:N-acetyltransferase domain-containing protein n=2 Tax=Astyanax mexicanus TaxID=7994 RepID=A0A8B9GZT9_ASTMX